MTVPYTCAEPYTLAAEELHDSLTDPVMASMNFLNEIADRYPRAVSLAPGRPLEDFFETESVERYLRRYREYLTHQRGYDNRQVREVLFQYGRTKGVVHELIAANLAVDEGIEIDPESIVVTVGAQEALFLTLRALRRDERDVLLTVRPTYLGITGAARMADLPIVPVRSGTGGVDVADFVARARQARAEGLRPRALYVIPDFANPTGLSLSVPDRHALLEAAASEGVLVIEDNPYGLFTGAERLPTLKALDPRRQVLYVGSFAKTGLPGARVGYAVADQPVTGAGLFADQLSMLKSMLTVNTPPVAQAVVAGKLLEHECSLLAANKREIETYESNRRCLLDGLHRRFGPSSRRERLGVTWNQPRGGFFVVVTVPFPVDDAAVEVAARDHGVLFTPVSHFLAGDEPVHELRLSCSRTDPAEIEVGLDRLAEFVDQRCR